MSNSLLYIFSKTLKNIFKAGTVHLSKRLCNLIKSAYEISLSKVIVCTLLPRIILWVKQTFSWLFTINSGLSGLLLGDRLSIILL